MIAVADNNVDWTSYTDLFLSSVAVLNYIDPPLGENAVSVQVQTTYQQIMFENSGYLDQITCGDSTITVVVTDSFAHSLVNAWPQNNFIIITNSPDCNSQKERGIYLVSSYTADDSTSTVTLVVTSAEWADISETWTISYGTVASSSSDTDAI